MDEQPPYQDTHTDPFRHPYPARPMSGLPTSGLPSSGQPSSGQPLPAEPASGPSFASGAAPVPRPVPISGTVPISSPLPISGSAAMMPVTAAYPVTEQVIAQIGDIQVTSTTVRTPAGQFPLRGSQWQVTDQLITEQKTATWAIVLAVVLLCPSGFLSLLFLLAKETIYRGVVQVQVANGPHQYVSRIPVNNQTLVQYVYQQVNYVRSLSVM
jgi:hypothetical protein